MENEIKFSKILVSKKTVFKLDDDSSEWVSKTEKFELDDSSPSTLAAKEWGRMIIEAINYNYELSLKHKEENKCLPVDCTYCEFLKDYTKIDRLTYYL